GQGTAVQWGHFQPGDLIFSNFEGPGAGASHVVIYAGHGQVIAAPHTGGHVEYEPVDWFKSNFVGARRVIPGGAPGVQSLDVAASAPPGTGPATISAAAVPGGVRPAGIRSTVQFMPAVGAAPDHALAALGDVAYPGDGASREQIADWMGAAAAKAGLPRELPVMAALVESGLKNDQYGDRDSVGFFQMRTSIWDEGPYKGFAQNPDLQVRWFIDQAVAVRRQRIAEGDMNFGQDPNSWGDWVADIERPAEQYRGRYALQLGTAKGLLGDS
ncbi:MAG: NlpC/P60 family protein, partial [Gaiellales bacterium]